MIKFNWAVTSFRAFMSNGKCSNLTHPQNLKNIGQKSHMIPCESFRAHFFRSQDDPLDWYLNNILLGVPVPCTFHYLYLNLGSQKNAFIKPEESNKTPLTLRSANKLARFIITQLILAHLILAQLVLAHLIRKQLIMSHLILALQLYLLNFR